MYSMGNLLCLNCLKKCQSSNEKCHNFNKNLQVFYGNCMFFYEILGYNKTFHRAYEKFNGRLPDIMDLMGHIIDLIKMI